MAASIPTSTRNDRVAAAPGGRPVRWRLWTRPWVRSALLALVPLLFALPFVGVEACACDGLCQSEDDVTVRVRVEQSGWDLVLGRTAVEGESHRDPYGTTEELDARAEDFIGDRVAPQPFALLVPLLGAVGAALFVFGSRPIARLSRVSVGLAGVVAAGLFVEAAITPLERAVEAFGAQLGVSWHDGVDSAAGDGAIAIGLVFLLPIVHEVVVITGLGLRALWRAGKRHLRPISP